jgi:hypothetical protein
VSFKTHDGIKVFTREDWNARPAKEAYSPLGDLHGVVYHHGGPVGRPRMTFKTAAQTVRSWQDYHMDFHRWNDIGYHYLMDGLGRLYLGRPASALGAHTLNQNSHWLGLNYMQDGRFYGLTPLQKKTTRKLIRDEHPRLHLPSLKSLIERPGDAGLFGHRERPGQSTECPGREILDDLHRLIKEA